MARHNETGKKGEDLAAEYLQKQGYTVLERNYRFGRYEIDIIAQQGKFLVFVEVKSKTNTSFGLPADEVTAKKAAQVTEAALEYIHQNQWKQEIRFDIVSVIFGGGTFNLEHITDAF
jgi:putative endonuclease